jgi:hypothetical protein
MASDVDVAPNRQIRFFGSFAEQEAEDIRFYRERSVASKMQDVADMAMAYARNRGMDLDAQGPKRFTQRVQRARG